MIVIFGSNSKLAKIILNHLCENFKILAISRSGIGMVHKNVTNVSYESISELYTILENNKLQIETWISCSAVRKNSLLVDESIDSFNKSFEINFFPNFIASKVLLPSMISKKKGQFIFFDSVKASQGDIGCSSYSISKETLRALQKSIVAEYSRFKIRCNIIGLLYFDSPMWWSLSEEKRKSLLKEVPGKQLISDVDIASTVLYIIQNNALNGVRLNLDFGLINGSY